MIAAAMKRRTPLTRRANGLPHDDGVARAAESYRRAVRRVRSPSRPGVRHPGQASGTLPMMRGNGTVCPDRMRPRSVVSVLALIAAVACTKPEPAPAAPPHPPAPAALPPVAKPPVPGIPAPADVAAPSADATKLPDGLAYRVITPGTGTAHPGSNDRVMVNYTGWTTDGKMFDSSVASGLPATFGVSGVITGWTEMLQLMTTGEKVLAWIPEALAYKGKPGHPAGMLVFEIELKTITAPSVPRPAPPVPTALAPPKAARKTPSGLAYTVLKKGTGKTHPTATSTVQLDYTGWTTDGDMFDSSITRGEPVSFPLDRVIAGWTEGVQLMVEGEKVRLWIPQELAYRGQKGLPAGMLVFDVDLIKIASP